MGRTTYKITLTAVFTVLIFGATMISFPIGLGYVNFGDVMIFIAAATMGWLSLPAAAIGSAFADVALGSAFYAPATLAIKCVMAVISVLITYRKNKIWRLAVGFLGASLFMQIGYLSYEVILLSVGNGNVSDIMAVFGPVKLAFGSLQTVFCVPIGVILTKTFVKLKMIDVDKLSLAHARGKQIPAEHADKAEAASKSDAADSDGGTDKLN